MSILTLSDLSLGYEGQKVISDLSFSVEPGSYLLIVGENGSGKSTLTRAILGLKAPMEGSIRYGEGLTHREVGYLPQQTIIQRDFPATVEEIVLSGFLSRRGLRPYYNREEKQEAQAILERLKIPHLKKSCYRELSGGQQQRVRLARALCAARRMLLLDEPVAGLDPQATDEMYALLAQLNRDGMTILMVSHDLHCSLPYASHVLYLGHDSSFFGTKEEFEEEHEGGHHHD